jgi:hypothetical protein
VRFGASPGWCESIIQRLSRRQKRCGSRGTGVTKRARGQRVRFGRPPDPTKGPYRWKTSRIEGSIALYGAAWRAVSAAHSPKGPAGAPKRAQSDTRKRLHTRRRVRPRERVGGDRDVRGSVFSSTVGRKRPRLRRRSVTTSARDAPLSGKRVRGDPPKRFGRRETFDPPVNLRGDLRLRGDSTRRKSGE